VASAVACWKSCIKTMPLPNFLSSMLAMIDAAKSDADADPRLWAPFVVVGEPAKPR
jgi:hypothetical protein